ncbi:MAG: hypothetical protein RLZZ450_3961 [Pseudomonadota bacterium]|jgi:hypothetical protein
MLLGLLLLASAACSDMHTVPTDADGRGDGAAGTNGGDGSTGGAPRDGGGGTNPSDGSSAGGPRDGALGADAMANAADGSATGGADGATGTFPDGGGARRGPRPVSLGAAAGFALLAKTAVSSVPTSAVTGDVGLSPAAASYITGFPYTRAGIKWTSPEVTGNIFAADNDAPTPSNMTTAVSNMETAYVDAAGRTTPDFSELGTGALGGRTLVPGLYKWSTSVTVSTEVVLAGGADDVWIFQISGGLTVAANTRVTLTGGARAQNVFWQVASPVDLGAGSHGEGTILCMTSINLQTGASVHGRLLAQSAVNIAMSSVTLP